MSSQHPRLLTGTATGRDSLLARYSRDMHRDMQQAALHRKTETAGETALMEVEVATKAKSDFIARMSHELRTPLNAIMGFAHILSHTHKADQRTQEYTGYIKEAAEHLLDTVNRMLDLSKIQAGSLVLARDSFHVEEIVPSAIQAVEEQARQRGIEIVTELAGDLGPIEGDAARIKQMLVNLLSNAVKFSHEGGLVRIGADMESEQLALSVADNGIGMTPSQVQAAVSPFGHGYAVSRRGHEGIGLGLAFCAAVIHLHRGRLDIRSTPGEGTVVTAHLPTKLTAHHGKQPPE
ncbi:sensor histidine kinase [Rhodoligotrophos ferricapiens]|uniref:sensor histidine kinase n=1 Tax=Rhodoligotrophos ferricapiens TaxID=3069264 RepID=UPI00315D6755